MREIEIIVLLNKKVILFVTKLIKNNMSDHVDAKRYNTIFGFFSTKMLTRKDCINQNFDVKKIVIDTKIICFSCQLKMLT